MKTKTKSQPFQFKQFTIQQDCCSMKVGTDGILLGAWAVVDHAKAILDIGTGSGLIAIMLAQRTKTARVVGVEIDESACGQARENMLQSPWASQLEAVQDSIQDFARSSTITFDLIVSNPPFFTGGNLSYNQDRNLVRHTIKMPHQDLLSAVRRLLSREGRFCLILPYLEGLRFCELAATYQLYCTKMIEVYPKADKRVERLLLQFEKAKKIPLVEQLIIQKGKENDWTVDFEALTKDFYLKG